MASMRDFAGPYARSSAIAVLNSGSTAESSASRAGSGAEPLASSPSPWRKSRNARTDGTVAATCSASAIILRGRTSHSSSDSSPGRQRVSDTSAT